jgi:hypothetical protein
VEGPVDDAMRVGLEHVGRSVVRTVGPGVLREIGSRIAEAGGGDPLLPEVLAELGG